MKNEKKIKVQHKDVKGDPAEIYEESLEVYKRNGWTEVKDSKSDKTTKTEDK